MTDTVQDVNAEFAASKRAQIESAISMARNSRERAEMFRAKVVSDVESGAMTDLGNNRYRVNQGWDAGETITLRTDLPTLDLDQIESAIMGNHGLDTMEDGRTALYVKGEPAWHALGQVHLDGLHTAAEVLSESGLAYTVAQKPVTFTPDGGELTKVPGSFVNYRTDNGHPLGVVGSRYTPAQNFEAYSFLDDLMGYGMVAESAGSFKDGSRVFITTMLTDDLIIDPEGVNDHVRMYLALLNSHDGSIPVTAIVTPWRIVCRNTDRFALRDAKYKWTVRHTRNWKDRANEAKKALNLTTAYYDEYRKESEALIQTVIGSDDVNALIDEIWGEVTPESTKNAVTIDGKRRDKVMELFKMESERVGRNAYAAQEAVTGYVDHFSELRPRSAALKGNRLAALGDAIMTESKDEPKHKAHKLLMNRVS